MDSASVVLAVGVEEMVLAVLVASVEVPVVASEVVPVVVAVASEADPAVAVVPPAVGKIQFLLLSLLVDLAGGLCKRTDF